MRLGWESAVHPEDRPRIVEGWRTFLESGTAGELEARLRRHDGEYRRFLLSAAPVTDPSGQIVRWCGISTDIEDRRQAEEKLRASERRLRRAEDALLAREAELWRTHYHLMEGQRLSQTASFSSDPAIDQHTWSEEFYRICDLEPDTKATIQLLRDIVHPKDLLAFDTVIARGLAGQDFDFVFRIQTPKGTLKYLHGVGRVVEHVEGRPVFVGAIQDVTAAKLAEEALTARESELRRAHYHLSEAQRLSRTGSFTSDPIANEHVWSDELYRIFEFDPGSPANIERARDIVHPEDKPRYDEVIEHARAGHEFNLVYRIVTHSGKLKHVHGVGHLVERVDGRPVFIGAVQDVTEAKVVEEALRASERYSRLIVDSIPAQVAVFTATGEVELVNRQILDYFGSTPEELKRWSSGEAAHPEDLPLVIERFSRSIATGEPFEIEVRARRSDGVYRWFQSRGAPLRDEGGGIIRWYNLLIDIDERKRAEEALKASEARLAHAHYHLTEGQRLGHTASFIGNPKTDEHTWSEEFYRICDFEPGSQATIQRLRDIVHPDDAASFDTVVTSGIAGQGFDFTFRIVTPKGALKYLRGVGRVAEHGASGPVFVGAIQDITDGKLAEESLRVRETELARAHYHLTEAQRLSRTGSFISDLSTDEHHWSNEMYRICEFEPGSKITVQRMQDIVHPDDIATFQATIARALAGDDPDFFFRIVVASGTVKYILGAAHHPEQMIGRPVFVGAMQDVTAARMAEDALNRARTELAHVSRSMTLVTLTASIAHEVNQPLSGIITNASTCLLMLASDKPNLERARPVVERILRDGKRASEVIRNLRSLSSRKAPRNEALDLNDATREVLTLSSNELQRSQVTLQTDLDPRLPEVMGDRVQLQQVILNLILNASDAMLQVYDRPRELRVATRLEGPGRILLSVRDSGVGIEPDNAERLFQAFFTTKKQGMGIGLSISRSIIESHAGKLWASANPGPGATFSFSIPCMAAPATPAPEAGMANSQ